ncbi:hypothetical protein DK847_10625 [Aestuariivirga litoralis]|uniref:Uncharacterized protein n=1 Tax=Aestuariivirga litoralis TaxID=2650924 RepID=A0A2W2BM29_9HYPH|nr:hypothetical protein DK847_10625 [Aestuariivirga litoralis]
MRWRSLASVAGCRSRPGFTRQSAASRRPPGKTYLLGMKAWPWARWPIRMRGAPVPRRTSMRVAESFGFSTLAWTLEPANSGWS